MQLEFHLIPLVLLLLLVALLLVLRMIMLWLILLILLILLLLLRLLQLLKLIGANKDPGRTGMYDRGSSLHGSRLYKDGLPTVCCTTGSGRSYKIERYLRDFTRRCHYVLQ